MRSTADDSWSFPLPTAPFTFIKAVAASGAYRTPVTSMTVEIRTSSSRFSGTDDDVYLRIGSDLRFPLDKSLYDDFERGDRDTYSVPIDGAARAGLTLSDLRRIQIEKSPDGVAGGWKLRGVKVIVNGRQVYARDGIETWLEDNHSTWRAPDFTPSSPATAAIPVTLDLWDEDSNIYGGNDHGDINSFASRKALTLAYTPGTNVDATATGGSTLGGRLGDGGQGDAALPAADAHAGGRAVPGRPADHADPGRRGAASATAAAGEEGRPRDHRDGFRPHRTPTSSPSRTRARPRPVRSR